MENTNQSYLQFTVPLLVSGMEDTESLRVLLQTSPVNKKKKTHTHFYRLYDSAVSESQGEG